MTTLQDIQAAAARIRPSVVRTPCAHSRTLSTILGTEIWLKFENLQFTSSFKERGALNKLLQLTETEKAQSVIAMSAGNHAKAVAYHAQRPGIPATIVMPKNTPNVKVEDTKNFDAKMLLEGNSIDESGQFARENYCFIHPYDDVAIIAGEGTIGIEMLDTNSNLETLVVPIGGGCLISGISSAAKAIKPDIRIVGVEVEGYASAYNQFHDRTEILGGSTIAEGIAVKKPGKTTMAIIKDLVDDILLVDEEAIEEAINQFITIERTVTEGAGTAALAAVASHSMQFKDSSTGVILCGANIDPRILAAVLMRRLIKKGRIVRYLIRIQDLSGTLSDITEVVGDAGGNILEVSHQRMFSNLPVKDADLYLTAETRDASQSQDILQRLLELGYETALLQG